jgi:hypothetical protein
MEAGWAHWWERLSAPVEMERGWKNPWGRESGFGLPPGWGFGLAQEWGFELAQEWGSELEKEWGFGLALGLGFGLALGWGFGLAPGWGSGPERRPSREWLRRRTLHPRGCRSGRTCHNCTRAKQRQGGGFRFEQRTWAKGKCSSSSTEFVPSM